MTMGAKEEYEARKQRTQAKHEAEAKAELEKHAAEARLTSEREEATVRRLAEQEEADRMRAASDLDAKRWWFRQKNPIDRFTGWLVAWTALLFLATALLFFATLANVVVLHHSDEKIGRQAEIASRQLDIMRGQTRPWLRGEFKLVKLSKNENGALNAEVDVRVINTGTYPAQIVWVGGAVLPNPQSRWQLRQKELCHDVVSAWGNILKNPTNVAFPNEWSPWSRQFTFTAPMEIAAWQNMVLMENGEKIPDPKPPWVFNIPLVFMGCITYSASADPSDIHQTGFMLDFASSMSPAGGPLGATFDVSGDAPKEYDISGITLIQGFRGAFGN